ncbi:MAG: DoxX family membrane protein [Nocardioides sp.]
MTVTRLIARPLLASTFFIGAVSAFKNAQALGPKAAPVTQKLVPLVQKAAPQLPIPTDPVLLVRLNAGVQLGAAAALATGHAPRLASTVLLASLVPTTVAGHRFWEEQDKAARKAQELHFFKNLSMVGGLILAGVDTDGKPGVAWRTRRAAKDARREAKHLAASARREAKLVRAQVS